MFVGIWHKSPYILKMTKYKVLLMHCYLFQQWSRKEEPVEPNEEYERKMMTNIFD